MAATYNDGIVPYGSRVIKIPVTTGDDFVAESISVSRGTKIIERNNELGEPSGWVAVPAFVTGTATLQIATGNAAPLLGETFTATFVTSIGVETFVLSEVSQPEAEGDIKKATISFRKKIN